MPSDDLDRDLPETLGGVAYGIALAALVDLPLGFLLGLRGVWLVLFAIGAGIVMGIAIKRMTTAIVEGTAWAFVYMIWPSGTSTPYSRTYSSAQALAARGDLDGALSAYRLAMRLNPSDPEPRLQAAEMFFRSETPGRAVPLYDEARRLSGAHELYVTQRLIDLYLGPLQSDVRAMVELRRLVDRFPGTREAEVSQRLYDELRNRPTVHS